MGDDKKNEVELSKTQAKEYLQIYIEDSARSSLYWKHYYVPQEKMVDSTADSGVELMQPSVVKKETPAAKPPTKEQLRECAERLYRNIVRSWSWDKFMRKVTQLAKISQEEILDTVVEINQQLKRGDSDIYKSLSRSAVGVQALAKVFGMEPGRLLKSEVSYEDVAAIGIPEPAPVYMMFKAHQEFWRPNFTKLIPIPALRKSLLRGFGARNREKVVRTERTILRDGKEHTQAFLLKSEVRKDVSPADKKRAVKEYGSVKFADAKNKKYPIDTEEHVRAAISYFAMPKNRGKYPTEERKSISSKILAAAHKFNISTGKETLKKSEIKAALEKLSVKLGHGGEINDAVLKHAQKHPATLVGGKRVERRTVHRGSKTFQQTFHVGKGKGKGNNDNPEIEFRKLKRAGLSSKEMQEKHDKEKGKKK